MASDLSEHSRLEDIVERHTQPQEISEAQFRIVEALRENVLTIRQLVATANQSPVSIGRNLQQLKDRNLVKSIQEKGARSPHKLQWSLTHVGKTSPLNVRETSPSHNAYVIKHEVPVRSSVTFNPSMTPKAFANTHVYTKPAETHSQRETDIASVVAEIAQNLDEREWSDYEVIMQHTQSGIHIQQETVRFSELFARAYPTVPEEVRNTVRDFLLMTNEKRAPHVRTIQTLIQDYFTF